jgi:hypothetical protein
VYVYTLRVINHILSESEPSEPSEPSVVLKVRNILTCSINPTEFAEIVLNVEVVGKVDMHLLETASWSCVNVAIWLWVGVVVIFSCDVDKQDNDRSTITYL